MEKYDLIISKLLARSTLTPNKQLFEFVNDDGLALAKVTYAEFELQTRTIAKRLVRHRQKKPSIGNIAMLVYPPGLDFIIAFVACLRAGIVAVPVYPPRGSKNKDLSMFLAVHANCKAKLALTNSLYNWASKVSTMKGTLGSIFSRRDLEEEGVGKWPEELEWIATDSWNSDDLAADNEIDIAQADAIAFLQYTSGSTSLPKGVVLTHGNLAHNLTTIITALKADPSVVVVSWLPMYHDMGLIGSHLGTIYCGGSATIFSPLSFVKNPPLWIDLISSRKATHLQAPNFAYRLTVRKFLAKQQSKQPLSNLDLSSVRHIFNAAEPIDPSAIDEFCETFGKYGLSKDAMVPGYGLAEHTVYVCDGGRQRLLASRKSLEKDGRLDIVTTPASSDSMWLVGCGSPPPDSMIRIIIVNPRTCRKVENGRVGEIWISSPSKSNAYYGMEEKSRMDLRARLSPNPVVDESKVTVQLADEPEEMKRMDSVDSLTGMAVGNADDANTETFTVQATEEELALEWLRTGDLGIWSEGELFICGRIKDMLIVRGRNHFPQDIEATVERADRDKIRPGCSAAFTVSANGEESVVVCFEVRPNVVAGTIVDEIVAKVRTNVAREHGISPRAVVLLVEHSIPKTTSGKISRHRVKHAFLTKKLKQVAIWESGVGGGDDTAVLAAEEEMASAAPNGISSAAVSAMPRTTLVGEALLQKLKAEAGSLLELDAAMINADSPMTELGFDSMMLTQFKGAVINVLGVELPDEQLFDEKCTLNKIRDMIENGPTDNTGKPPGADGASRGDAVDQTNASKQRRERQPLLGSWKPGAKMWILWMLMSLSNISFCK